MNNDPKRHAAEVRYVVQLYRTKGPEVVKGFLANVSKSRGEAAAQQLREEAKAMIKEQGSCRA